MAELEYKYAPPDIAYVVYGDGLSHCRVRCVEVLRECDELEVPAYFCRFIDKGSDVAVRDILGGAVTHKIFYEEELMGEREAREKALRKLKEYRDVMQAEIEDINRRMAMFYDKSTDCCIIDVEAGPWATAITADLLVMRPFHQNRSETSEED